jgi:AcrR family transcriptional regulator
MSSERETARDRLIAATRRVITEQGVVGASSRAITSAAGENLASITYYFGSKDALVTTALIAHVRDLIDPVLVELHTDGPLPTKLIRCVTLLNALFSEHRNELPTFVECLATASRNPTVAAELRSLFEQLTGTISDEIGRQQTAGAIPVWVQPRPMAQLVISIVHGVIVRAATDLSFSAPDAFAIGHQFIALTAATSGVSNPP